MPQDRGPYENYCFRTVNHVVVHVYYCEYESIAVSNAEIVSVTVITASFGTLSSSNSMHSYYVCCSYYLPYSYLLFVIIATIAIGTVTIALGMVSYGFTPRTMLGIVSDPLGVTSFV